VDASPSESQALLQSGRHSLQLLPILPRSQIASRRVAAVYIIRTCPYYDPPDSRVTK